MLTNLAESIERGDVEKNGMRSVSIANNRVLVDGKSHIDSDDDDMEFDDAQEEEKEDPNPLERSFRKNTEFNKFGYK